MTIKANRIERYYDTHEVEGAELTQSRIHYAVIRYLTLVLEWLFYGQGVGVTGNVNFYQTENPHETSKSPDIAVVDGLEVEPVNLEEMPSYYVGEDGPPPRVVFEVSSKDTWRQDLEEKPARYALMGIKEYFVFDPNSRSFWTGQWRKHNRLIGWRRNPALGQYELLVKDEAGRLWSEELASWLVIEPEGLRLYTADGQLRLTEAEAYQQKAENLQQSIEVERQKAETERQKAQRLAEILKNLGYNSEESN
jgi:Uma2 family endonuclease